MKNRTTKTEHFIALDGVRGIAAISVLIFHLGRWLQISWLGTNGNLSVDMFFTLSGFVLALAYTRRAKELSLFDFFKLRMIRLTPLIIVGTIVSASYVIFKGLFVDKDVALTSVLLATSLGLINIPYFNPPSAIGGPQIFPLNGPQFSLFFEIVANLIWWATRSFNQVRFSTLIYIVSVVCLVIFGIGGDKAENFWSGFANVGSSFSLGILLFHLDRRIPVRTYYPLIFWGLCFLMLLLLYMPIEAPFWLKLFWRLVLAPLLVLSGSHVRVGADLMRPAQLLGDLSYPVYALHYPLFCWVNGLFQKATGHKNPTIEAPLVFLVVILVSYLALHRFDRPVRAFLTNKLTRSHQAKKPVMTP